MFSAPRYFFPHYLTNGTIFVKKNIKQNAHFHFLYNAYPKHFSIPDEFSEIPQIHFGLHVQYPLFFTDFNQQVKFLGTVSKNPQISNFKKIRPVGSELFNADRRANTTKLRVTFRNSADEPTSIRNVNAGG
jgi:hypothetical protein